MLAVGFVFLCECLPYMVTWVCVSCYSLCPEFVFLVVLHATNIVLCFMRKQSKYIVLELLIR